MNDEQTPLDPEKVLEQAMADLGRDTEARDGGPTAPPVAELAPSFPDYRIEGLIGQGGMGAVYRARHLRLDRDVALKVLPKELAEDPAFEERFVREARTLALLDHDHVLRVHDFGEAGGWFYLVTEYVDGVNLRQMMQLGRLTPEEAVRLVPQICDALHFAHAHGVVHRDIKPENILVDQGGDVKIADFGLAKLLGDPAAGGVHLTRTQQVLGTPHYMAPEQIERPTIVDHRADIFSLGVVFYEMLTGQLPLGNFQPPSAHSQASRQLDPVVMRSLEREPDRRYQTVDALKSDVVGGGSKTGETSHAKLDRLRTQRHRRHGRHDVRPVVAAGLLAIGLLGGVVMFLTDDVGWSYVAAALLAAASVTGFRALSIGFRTDGRSLRPACAVFAAWLPVLLLANVMVMAAVAATGIIRSERSAGWMWGLLFLADLMGLAWFARRRHRSGR